MTMTMTYDMKQHHNPQESDTVQLTTKNCTFVRGDTPLVQETAHTLRGEGFDASEDGTGRGTPLVQPVAFSCKDNGRDALSEVAPTMRSMSHSGSHANGGGQLAVAYGITDDETTMTECLPTMSTPSASGGGHPPAVATAMQVRRLTPEECEALQGFPRSYTDIQPNGKPTPDGPRYKALGNSMAVPVMRWIGKQIQAAVDYDQV